VELQALMRLKDDKWMASFRKKNQTPKKFAKDLEAEANMFGRAKKANAVRR
jgi:hypothetical protein